MKIPKRLATSIVDAISKDEVRERMGEDTVTVIKAALALGDSNKVAMLAATLLGCLSVEDYAKLKKAVDSDEAFKMVVSNTAIFLTEE